MRAQCIIAMLPFLDDIEVEDEVSGGENQEEGGLIQLNAGAAGVSRTLTSEPPTSSDPPQTGNVGEGADASAPAPDTDVEESSSDGSTFVTRRLSVSVLQYDEEDEEA